MSKIALVPNPYRDRGLALTNEARRRLEAAGFDIVISPAFVDVPADSAMLPIMSAAEGAELIITFGGDGTMLHVARRVIELGIPMLGVNVGTKGFMAGIEPEDLPLVVAAARGEYRRSERMLLDVTLTRAGGDTVYDRALNDAVVKSDVNCVDLLVSSDGERITRFSGDGVIISTPTGSTAYSMSAGGPIVEPEARNIIVTPICAHSMAARSFVLSPGRKVTVTPERRDNRRVLLSVDGSVPVDLENGDEVLITKSANSLVMADVGVRSFYDTALGKLTQ